MESMTHSIGYKNENTSRMITDHSTGVLIITNQR